MTKEEREEAIVYLEEIKEYYIDGYGYERHPLPEYYAIEAGIKALSQLQIPDNVTNGDVIKIIFPQMNINKKWKATRHGDILSQDKEHVELALSATSDWWDAPYRSDK